MTGFQYPRGGEIFTAFQIIKSWEWKPNIDTSDWTSIRLAVGLTWSFQDFSVTKQKEVRTASLVCRSDCCSYIKDEVPNLCTHLIFFPFFSGFWKHRDFFYEFSDWGRNLQPLRSSCTSTLSRSWLHTYILVKINVHTHFDFLY